MLLLLLLLKRLTSRILLQELIINQIRCLHVTLGGGVDEN